MSKEIDIEKLFMDIKQQENTAWENLNKLDVNSQEDIRLYWYNMGKHAVLQGLLMAVEHGVYDKKEE